TFVIRNVGSLNAQYSLSASCGSFGGCAPNHSALSLAAGASDSVRVTVNVPEQPLAAAAIALVATYNDGWGHAIGDTGVVQVNVPSVSTLYRPSIRMYAGPTGGVIPPQSVSQIIFHITNAGLARATYFVAANALGGFSLP